MTDKEQDDYEVGYKKPPFASRFKKGQSGNPSGRRRKVGQELDPGKVLQSIDNEEIRVKIDGRDKRMRKAEVYFQQLFTRAIKGDLAAARIVAVMAVKYFGPEADGPPELNFIVVPNDYYERRRNQNDAKGKT
jgi:Family of unknown function (DUF5681)